MLEAHACTMSVHSTTHTLLLTILTVSVYTQQLIKGVVLKEVKVDEDFSTQSMGCIFGGANYEFDSKWHPVLEPYGIMYCLECSCNTVIKKGLLQHRGQVLCRRISQDCPDISHCADRAILPPNSCCKICPEHLESSVVGVAPPASDWQSRLDHRSTSNRKLFTEQEYQAVLTASENSTTEVVGRVHLLFDRSSLQVTMEISRFLRLKTLQFVTRSDQILHEQKIESTESYRRKFCTVWASAFKHIETFKSGGMQVKVTSADNPTGELQGVITQTSLDIKQSFSALLTDLSRQSRYAAALSLAVNTRDKSLIVTGLVKLTSAADLVKGKETITVQILRDWRVLHSANEILTVSQSRGGGEFELRWSGLSTSNLKQLARGRLGVRITVRQVEITGPIITWHQCGTLNVLVSGADAVPRSDSSGVAIGSLNLRPNGKLEYTIQMKRIESKVLGLYIETDRTGGVQANKITRLTRDFDRATGLVTGVYDKPDAVEIQLLVEGRLFINIETRELPTSALRGQIVIRPYTSQPGDAVLMSSSRSGMAAVAWCSTAQCTMTCHILVPRVSVRRDRSTRAYLDYWDTKHPLATFTDSNMMEASISQVDVAEISSTSPTLRIVTNHAVIFGQVKVPRRCFDTSPGNRTRSRVPQGDENGKNKTWTDPNIPAAHKCSYDSVLYEDGDTWSPGNTSQDCNTCSCKRGRVQCHPVICPSVSCDTPVMLPGECCPACPPADADTSKQCFFPGDHRHHTVGTVWHPFMHPKGYFTCAVCFCKTGGNGFDCKTSKCPALSCDSRLASRKPGDCCPTCPETGVETVTQSVDTSQMFGDSDSFSSCKVGNTVYSNGEAFNPEIGPFGVYGNVQCRCKNSVVECEKIECECGRRSSRRNRCCIKQCGYTSSDMLIRNRKRQKGKRKEVIC